MNKLYRYLLVAGLAVISFASQAMEFSAQKVADGVYAYVGPITDRTPENLGLNNNIGFIDTADGWVLVDSGAGDAAAKKLEAIAKGIKNQPIVAVINIGSQDHRWLGNDYFSKQGAKIYAFKKSVKTQAKMFNQQLDRLLPKVPALKGVQMKTADVVLEEASNSLTIGGVEMQLNYYGDAHFPGDSVLWLPQQKVLFTGDIVYLDRMLGVHPWSNPVTWNEAYQQMRQLPSEYIVPGHGKVSDWKQADAETGDYLKKLVEKMTAQAEDFAGVNSAVSENSDWPEFKHLEHYDSWHKQNLNRTYLKLEASM
ncbi:MBL fold metallo-hydrolase [Thiomicrorhabdus sp. 6S2-11]|uniref:MBL fold metallo-hydrolase n=1 Tax=Thiomicrorhabdus marina TaxID=2818442 RepID=A0ABS3Q4J0_9GAMM|nr:MBL fold metallo-hydrolase [Thiomicrorhabdus marina]MBO1927254.1 MBL fold metallo-hydrolase [Thiomicrorhabdus marina]